MRIFYLFIFFILFSCGKEGSADISELDTQDGNTMVDNKSKPEVSAELPPRSGGCNFVSDEQILEVITGEKDGASITNLPGRTVSACYYRLDALRWSGDLVVDVTDGMDASNLLKEIEGAEANEKLRVAGQAAQLTNGNRVLRVASAPPFELKLSILPKAGYKDFADDTDRKRMLTELAEILAKR